MTAVEQREGELASAGMTPAETSPYHGALATMAIGALGVVYGDIGTSPLCTFKTAIECAGGEVTPTVALGACRLWCGRSSSPPR
jgi:KUP system potassium uptake protein